MRVVSGTARGRRLDTPAGRTVRPTSDRVREAVFNALGSLDVVRDAEVVDLFAGSGALGIEALSRGAAHVTFVERDPTALAVIRRNLDATGLSQRATVRRGDALEEMETLPAVDLVLADPPYSFDDWDRLLGEVRAATVVAESDRAVEFPDPWQVLRERRYGSTVVTIARCTDRDDHGRPIPEDRS